MDISILNFFYSLFFFILHPFVKFYLSFLGTNASSFGYLLLADIEEIDDAGGT